MSKHTIQVRENNFIPFDAIEDIEHIHCEGNNYVRIEFTTSQDDYHSMVIPSSSPFYPSLKKFVRA